MKPLLCALCLCVVVLCAVADERKAPVDPGAAPDVQDVIFLGKSRPVLLRIHLFHDGQPFSHSWDAYVEKLFKFADRDNNASLDRDEVKRLPSGTLMQLMVRGSFNPNGAPVLSIAQLDSDNDDKVTLAEVRAYYSKQAQVAAMQIVSGNPYGGQPAVNPISQGAFKHLGATDGKIELAKLTRELADGLVGKLDGDDDETLSTMEISVGAALPVTVYQGGGFGTLGGRAPTSVGESAFLLLPKEIGKTRLDERMKIAQDFIKRYDKDQSGKLTRQEIGFDSDAFQKLDKDGDGLLSANEVTRYFVVAPDVELTARLGKRGDKPAIELTPGSQSTLAAKVSQASLETLTLSLSTLQMELRTSSPFAGYGSISSQLKVYYLNQFDTLTAGKMGVLDLRENPKMPLAQALKGVFEMCDRDGDGKLTKPEFEAGLQTFLDANGTTYSLMVNETSKGLFELLDANRDGRLSVRELRRAKEVLAAYDLNADGSLSEDEIPVQLSVAIGPGNQQYYGRQGFNPYQPAPTPRPALLGGPLWFRKMDRNGDGDLSRREFLGTPEQFQKIDRDGDGLISRAEAEQASAAK